MTLLVLLYVLVAVLPPGAAFKLDMFAWFIVVFWGVTEWVLYVAMIRLVLVVTRRMRRVRRQQMLAVKTGAYAKNRGNGDAKP